MINTFSCTDLYTVLQVLPHKRHVITWVILSAQHGYVGYPFLYFTIPYGWNISPCKILPSLAVHYWVNISKIYSLIQCCHNHTHQLMALINVIILKGLCWYISMPYKGALAKHQFHICSLLAAGDKWQTVDPTYIQPRYKVRSMWTNFSSCRYW